MVVRVGSNDISVVDYNDVKTLIDQGATVVLDFSASWCGPCKKLYPCLQRVAEKYPNVYIFKLDVDDEDDEEVVSTYKISSLPTLLVFNGGERVDTQIGFSVDKLVDSFFNLLTTPSTADDDSVPDQSTLLSDLRECFA